MAFLDPRSDERGCTDGPAYCCQDDGMVGLGCGARSYTRGLHYALDYAVAPKEVKAILADYLARGEGDFAAAGHGFALDAGEPQVWYSLANAKADVPLEQVVVAHGRRHGMEEMRQAAKGAVGLGQYEVRRWVGWRHPMTPALLALWFLLLEKGRLEKKPPALTVPQLRAVFARLLQPGPPRPGRIAAEVRRVLRRNEEARTHHWYAATGKFPPRRKSPHG